MKPAARRGTLTILICFSLVVGVIAYAGNSPTTGNVRVPTPMPASSSPSATTDHLPLTLSVTGGPLYGQYPFPVRVSASTSGGVPGYSYSFTAYQPSGLPSPTQPSCQTDIQVFSCYVNTETELVEAMANDSSANNLGPKAQRFLTAENAFLVFGSLYSLGKPEADSGTICSPSSAVGPSPLQVSFTLTAAGPDASGSLFYEWALVNGSAVPPGTGEGNSAFYEIYGTNASSLTYTFTTPGVYYASGWWWQTAPNNGIHHHCFVSIIVTDSPLISPMSASATRGQAPFTVKFGLSASHGMAPYKYHWECKRVPDFGETGAQDCPEFADNTPDIAATFTTPGVYAIKGTTVDSSNAAVYTTNCYPSSLYASCGKLNQFSVDTVLINVCSSMPCLCDDERDSMIQEYIDYGVNWVPDCADFTQTAHSAHFSFSDLNTGDYSWAIVKDSMLTGLEKTRSNYGKPMIISSAYRNPKHNAELPNAATQSRHMFGDAADVDVSDCSAWNALSQAAHDAGAWVEPVDQSDLRHVHMDWGHSGPNTLQVATGCPAASSPTYFEQLMSALSNVYIDAGLAAAIIVGLLKYITGRGNDVYQNPSSGVRGIVSRFLRTTCARSKRHVL